MVIIQSLELKSDYERNVPVAEALADLVSRKEYCLPCPAIWGLLLARKPRDL